MERPLLNDPGTYPADTVIASALGDCYAVYQAFEGALPDYQIALEWRYYNDGKSWLGKAVSKKKTVFWLSVWQEFFKLSFYFTEKTRQGVLSLPIAEELKARLENQPLKGKLVGLVLEISESTQLEDAFTLISYKVSSRVNSSCRCRRSSSAAASSIPARMGRIGPSAVRTAFQI